MIIAHPDLHVITVAYCLVTVGMILVLLSVQATTINNGLLYPEQVQFDWQDYLVDCGAIAAPTYCFAPVSHCCKRNCLIFEVAFLVTMSLYGDRELSTMFDLLIFSLLWGMAIL